jgi:hypothetical protein
MLGLVPQERDAMPASATFVIAGGGAGRRQGRLADPAVPLDEAITARQATSRSGDRGITSSAGVEVPMTSGTQVHPALSAQEVTFLTGLGQQLRADSIRCSTAAGSGHPTPAMPVADQMAVLPGRHLRYDRDNPGKPGNNHLIFSKGHASPLLYDMFKAAGVITDEALVTGFRRLGSRRRRAGGARRLRAAAAGPAVRGVRPARLRDSRRADGSRRHLRVPHRRRRPHAGDRLEEGSPPWVLTSGSAASTTTLPPRTGRVCW